jgi:hypothetical protein
MAERGDTERGKGLLGLTIRFEKAIWIIRE